MLPQSSTLCALAGSAIFEPIDGVPVVLLDHNNEDCFGVRSMPSSSLSTLRRHYKFFLCSNIVRLRTLGVRLFVGLSSSESISGDLCGKTIHSVRDGRNS